MPGHEGVRSGALIATVGIALALCAGAPPDAVVTRPASVALTAPRTEGRVSVEQALRQRRSAREWSGTSLTLDQLAQLLWAAQGLTSGDGRRTAPSAGALYPLELVVVAGAVEGLAPGVYRYRPAGHQLEAAGAGDQRHALAQAARGQGWLARAPATIVVAAEPSRTAARYGERTGRYVAFEAGAAAQNLALQAEALGLGTVVVGAFDDPAVGRVAALRPGEEALALLPVGGR